MKVWKLSTEPLSGELKRGDCELTIDADTRAQGITIYLGTKDYAKAKRRAQQLLLKINRARRKEIK